MKLLLPVSTLIVGLAFSTLAHAEPLKIGAGDTIAKLLAAHVGKVVTLKLEGSDELTGKVESASDEIVHLSQLSGKEFFDAAVATDSIAAVLVRTR